MATDSVTSGELYFRLLLEDEKRCDNDVKIPSSMRAFLKRKDEPNKDIINLRQRVVQVLISRLNYLNTTLPIIRGLSNSLKMRIFREKLLIKSLLENKGQEFDACALQSILQYSAVLQEEILDAQKSLAHERAMKETLQLQAKITRNLLLFSVHLSLETKCRIELAHLSSSTAQYVRCVKAVHDNLHNCFGFNPNSRMIPDTENVSILNIFKLKHAILSRNLQKATGKVTGAKMKGLFCSMPIDNIYRFAVHGLREQKLPATMPDYAADPGIRDCFRTPWIFCNQDQPLTPLPQELHETLREAGFASRQLNVTTQRPVLRFSKYSTMSTMLSYSEPQLQQGLCLALCRVLIVRMKTISTFIEDFDISAAVQQGYDAIYSTLSEEYALLQPQYVLPEFFIHADFTSLKQPSLTSTSTSTSPTKRTSSEHSPVSSPRVSSSVLPSYLRVSGATAESKVSSSINHTTWSPTNNIPCPQHVLLSNHYRSIVHSAPEIPFTAHSEDMNLAEVTRSSSHQHIVLKQSALQTIETAVVDFRQSMVSAKLAIGKRLLQWCSEDQKHAAAAVRLHLQHQFSTSSTTSFSHTSQQRKLFLSDSSATNTTNSSVEETASSTRKSPSRRDNLLQQQQQQLQPQQRTLLLQHDEDGLMVMVTEAMRAVEMAEKEQQRARPQRKSPSRSPTKASMASNVDDYEIGYNRTGEEDYSQDFDDAE